MFQRLIIFLLALAATAGAVADNAAPDCGERVAVVDMELIFKEYYKTKLEDMRIKKQAEFFKAYAQTLDESRMKLEQEYKELRDASLNIALTETERERKRFAAQDKYRQLKMKESECADYGKEKQDVLKESYEKKRGEILKDIQRTTEKHALLQGYSLVLDCSGKTLNNIPSVIYHEPSRDLTKVVIEDLNRGHESKSETGKDKELRR